jgi:hypothetical protein
VSISCTQRRKPKKKNCKEKISKEFFAGGKAKLTYFEGGRDLFTLEFKVGRCILSKCMKWGVI